MTMLEVQINLLPRPAEALQCGRPQPGLLKLPCADDDMFGHFDLGLDLDDDPPPPSKPTAATGRSLIVLPYTLLSLLGSLTSVSMGMTINFRSAQAWSLLLGSHNRAAQLKMQNLTSPATAWTQVPDLGPQRRSLTSQMRTAVLTSACGMSALCVLAGHQLTCTALLRSKMARMHPHTLCSTPLRAVHRQQQPRL